MMRRGRGWYGESGRHSLAARGIPTTPKKGSKYVPRIPHRRAKEWAQEILFETPPEEVDTVRKVMDGNEYMLQYEGWSPYCFLEIEGIDPIRPERSIDEYDELGELEEECFQYAYKVGNRLLAEDWPRVLEPRGWKMVDGEHDEQRGQFGMTWALWVRGIHGKPIRVARG